MKALRIGAAVCTAMTLAAANAAEPKTTTGFAFDVRFVGEEQSFAARSRDMRKEAGRDGWIFQAPKGEDDSWGDHVGDSGDRGGDWHGGDWHGGDGHHDDGGDDDFVAPSPVPEAATWQMLALGAALFGLTRIRAKRKRASLLANITRASPGGREPTLAV